MNRKILEEVKSQFTDDLIQTLIEKYISCGCDDNLFYSSINHLETTDNYDNHYTNELIKYIFNVGLAKYDSYGIDKQSGYQFLYESNNSWVTISSEQDPMNEQRKISDDKRPLTYRIYLNLKGKEKSDFVLSYINRCKGNDLPYKFKFSIQDQRNDQIVLLSSSENFEENLSIIEELTKNLQLGNLPMLIGVYKDGIGIAEEFYNRLYSPTQVRLALVRTSVKKYLCDHKDEFYENLSDDEKKKIDEFVGNFKYLYDAEMDDKEYFGEEYEDLNKNYYQRKSSIDCAKEHIENDRDSYVCGDGLLELGSAIQQIYSNNAEQFIHEVTQNYRMIGTQVWGISQDFVFSNETEEKFMQSKENDKMLSAKQIGTELEVMSRKGIVDGIQVDLIAMAKGEEKQTQREQ